SIVRAVFCRKTGSPVYENEIVHIQGSRKTCSAINEWKSLQKALVLFSFMAGKIKAFKNFECGGCQRDCPIAVRRFRWPRPPAFLLMPKFQCLVDGQCPIVPVDDIPC